MFWYTHVYYLLSALEQHKKAEGKKANLTSFYTKLPKWTGQNHWHPIKTVGK